MMTREVWERMIDRQMRAFKNVYMECLTCGLEADDNTLTEDGTVRAGTFEANLCPNCGSYNVEVK